MFLIYLWGAWIVGCGTWALISGLWRNHKRRSERMEELEKENRNLKRTVELLENEKEISNIYGRRIICDGHYENI